MNNGTSAEQILNNIFDIMQQLYDEMRLSSSARGDHLHVFDIFAELGRTLADADRASFWRWDKPTHKLITNAATGIDQIIIDDTTGLVGRALAENRTIVTNDPYNHPDFNSAVDKRTGYVTKSILVMPVSNCRGEVIGAFQVINKLGDAGFDEVDDAKRLSIAAFICGMALESDLFLADSQRDKLTELKNRFGLYSDWQTTYQRFERLALVMCDIDHFKRVNDTYGHNAGDAVLKNVARILRSTVGDGGTAYRWGGEEFVIVLKDVGLDGAVEIAERIRRAAEASSCLFDGQEIRATMSFGCSELDRAHSIDENIKVADERLYRAKETGRNRVIAE